MKELEIEKDKLAKTIITIDSLLKDEKQDLKQLYENFIGEREELWQIADRKSIHIRNLEVSKNKPYFARIDFQVNNEEKIYNIYIGKTGIINHNSEIVVTDWRAPISSLYYDSEIGNCSFEAPEGIIDGNMSLKRQYIIENGNLIEYFDVDLVSNDDLLQQYLNNNNDERLKNIVATIQKEQNEVIRKQLINNLIIQGVAGSGKTTVALHRIAYLVYNYRNIINQNQFLVIGPNPVFIKYIQSVLPDLDVSGVKQYTFEDFTLDYISENININSSDKKINASISGKINNDVDKFKSSLKFKNMLDKFLNEYISSLTSEDLKIGAFKILDKNIIKNIFDSTNTNYNYSLSSRIELTIELLIKYISRNFDNILSSHNDYFYEIFKSAKTEQEKNNLRIQFNKEREELKKNCRSLIRKYFSKAKLNCSKLYKLFIESIENFDLYKYNYLATLKKDTLKNIKKGNYDFEDLAALLFIQYRFNPNKDYQNIRHTIVDEAQDLGEFNFYILKKILANSTFSIFGDLAQAIYDYRGIDSWQTVNQLIFDNKAQIINFTKSYRTTAEIMHVADEIALSIGQKKSDLVVRHGNQVQFTKCFKNNIPDYIIKRINEFKEKGYKTIAIISKTNLLSFNLNDDLVERGLIIPNITINDDVNEEKYHICTISNQLAKGLEFDAVIINNADEKIYSSNSSLDMKLLYVAVTRALHELDIVYDDTISKVLQEN